MTRKDFLCRDKQDQIWIIKTETEIENDWVSKKRGKKGEKRKRMMKIVATTSLPAYDLPNADHWNAARSCQKMQVSMTRPRLSQWRDRDQAWKIWVSMTRLSPRLKKSESQKRDWAKDFINETPLRLLLISDSPLVGRGMIFAPWNEFYRILVFWLAGLDF